MQSWGQGVLQSWGLAVMQSCSLEVKGSCSLAVKGSCSLAVLQSCSLEVLQSRGQGVLQSCSLAVLQSWGLAVLGSDFTDAPAIWKERGHRQNNTCRGHQSPHRSSLWSAMTPAPASPRREYPVNVLTKTLLTGAGTPSLP